MHSLSITTVNSVYRIAEDMEFFVSFCTATFVTMCVRLWLLIHTHTTSVSASYHVCGCEYAYECVVSE